MSQNKTRRLILLFFFFSLSFCKYYYVWKIFFTTGFLGFVAVTNLGQSIFL